MHGARLLRGRHGYVGVGQQNGVGGHQGHVGCGQMEQDGSFRGSPPRLTSFCLTQRKLRKAVSRMQVLVQMSAQQGKDGNSVVP